MTDEHSQCTACGRSFGDVVMAPWLTDYAWRFLATYDEVLCADCFFGRVRDRGFRLTLVDLEPCQFNLMGRPSWLDYYGESEDPDIIEGWRELVGLKDQFERAFSDWIAKRSGEIIIRATRIAKRTVVTVQLVDPHALRPFVTFVAAGNGSRSLADFTCEADALHAHRQLIEQIRNESRWDAT